MIIGKAVIWIMTGGSRSPGSFRSVGEAPGPVNLIDGETGLVLGSPGALRVPG